jgi:hypothetical protein
MDSHFLPDVLCPRLRAVICGTVITRIIPSVIPQNIHSPLNHDKVLRMQA